MIVLPSGIGAASKPADSTVHFDVPLYTGNATYPRSIPVLADPRDGFILQRRRGSGTGFTNAVLPNSGSYKYVKTHLAAFSTPATVSSVTINAASIDLTANADLGTDSNESAADDMFWILAKIPGILDVVNYAGNGANRTISHSLGSVPGAVYIHKLTAAGNVRVGHRGLSSYTSSLQMNTSGGAASDATVFNSTAPTSSVFSLGTNTDVNAAGQDYVAYLFGHDTGGGGKIQCGSYTGNGSSSGPTVSLGWDPRGIIIKRTVGSSSWQWMDQFRTPSFSGADARMHTDVNTADSAAANVVSLTGTGFQIVTADSAFNGATDGYIYIAIR